MTSPIGREFRTITRLAIPVVATQLGAMMLWVVDLVMVGGVGVVAIDTVSLGRLWIMGTLTLAMGTVFGIDPILTQAWGARNPELMGRIVQRGAVLAMLISVPTMLSWLVSGRALVALGQDPALSGAADAYVRVQLPLVPLFLLFTVLRQYLLARGLVYPTMWVMFVGNAVNVVANYALIFGKLGAPELGVIGAGIATVVTQGFMFVALAVWIVAGKLYEGAWAGWDLRAWRIGGLGQVFRFGFPVGLQLSLEMWAFMSATLLAGWLGHAELAAHTVVINLASISFMVPLGISFGTVTRVGNLIGEGNAVGAQRAAWVSFAMGAGVMTVSAVLFIVGRWWLPALYTDDAEVIALSAAILPVAAAFQWFDGAQVCGGGVLRGMGKTRPAAVFNIVGYYVLALPAAYFLAFRMDMGLAGIWWGLVLGLAVVAALLMGWVWWRGPAKVDARIAEVR